jgi:hypothetical protein
MARSFLSLVLLAGRHGAQAELQMPFNIVYFVCVMNATDAWRRLHHAPPPTAAPDAERRGRLDGLAASRAKARALRGPRGERAACARLNLGAGA